MRRLRPPTLRTTEAPAQESRPAAPLISPAILAGAITSGQMSLTQEAAYSVGGFTTTNTTDWQTVISVVVPVLPGNVALYHWSLATPQHTAAAAEVSLRLLIYTNDALVAAYQLAVAPNIYMATANKNVGTICLSQGFNVPSDLPSLIPGARTMLLQAFNHTAGTLTLAAGADKLSFQALIAGDAT